MATSSARSMRELPAVAAARRVLLQRLSDVDRAVVCAGAKRATSESIHRLRVATRRASAVLQAFRPFVPRRPRRWLMRALRRMRHAAGEARDLDVLIARYREPGSLPGPGLRCRVLHMLVALRPATRQSIVDQASAPRRRTWRVHAADVVAGLRLSSADASVAACARRRCRRLAVDFLKRADRTLRDGRHVHRVRIEGKRLRYAVEVCIAVGGRKAVESCDRPLRSLQKRLGDYTDHAAAARRLREWANDGRTRRARHDLRTARREEVRHTREGLRRCIRWWNATGRRKVSDRVTGLVRKDAT
ncbi:MAG: CHAD domain-containing protein [Planctomycetaceae bacterium]